MCNNSYFLLTKILEEIIQRIRMWLSQEIKSDILGMFSQSECNVARVARQRNRQTSLVKAKRSEKHSLLSPFLLRDSDWLLFSLRSTHARVDIFIVCVH